MPSVPMHLGGTAIVQAKQFLISQSFKGTCDSEVTTEEM